MEINPTKLIELHNSIQSDKKNKLLYIEICREWNKQTKSNYCTCTAKAVYLIIKNYLKEMKLI